LLGADLVKKMETDRESLAPQLRGTKLEEFAAQWVAQNLDKKQQQLFGGYVTNRFRKGRLAIPLDVFEKLNAHRKHVFATDAAMKAAPWPDSGMTPVLRLPSVSSVRIAVRIADRVPATRPTQPAVGVIRFQNIPRMNVANSGALKKPNRVCR
jgi:hypothetical protein